MTAVYYTLGVVAFAFAILTSIGLHELGHLVPAKAFGGKVTQYFIGFGPTLWSRTRGETEYGVKAIPLGGYVKIVGMLPPGAEQLGRAELDEHGEPVLTLRRSNTGMFTQLISDARAAEWEHISPEDEPRLFYRMPWWQKVIVMSAGPSVNIAIAFFVFWGVFAFYGNPSDPGLPVVGTVSRCVIPASAGRTSCVDTDPESPAAMAGLRTGDKITSFNRVRVTDDVQLRTLIRGNEGGRAVIGFERDGRAMSATTDTTVNLVQTSATDTKLVQAGFLGVTFAIPTYAHGGPVYTVEQMGVAAKETAVALVHLPVRVWGVAEAIVGERPRDPNSPVSIVGGGRMAGETASAKDFPLSDKLGTLALLIASFNFFIGAFNFVPLLPLDGGHIASALWEAVRRGWARLRRRPDPGHVDAARLLPVAYVAASLMLVMSLVLIVGDIVVPLSITG